MKGKKLVPIKGRGPAPDPHVLPDYITQAPLMKKNVIRSKGLTRYQEQMMLLFTPAMMRTVLEQIWIGAKKGDIAFVKLAADALGLVEKSSGVNIIQNINQNQLTQNNNSGFQFDRIIRQLAGQERSMDALPPTGDDRVDH